MHDIADPEPAAPIRRPRTRLRRGSDSGARAWTSLPKGRAAIGAIAVLAGLFALLAAAVAGGLVDSADRFSERELAPLRYGPQRDHPFAVAWLNAPLTAMVSMAAPFLSTVLFSIGCAIQVYRGRTRRAILWALAFAAAFGIEIAMKAWIDPSFPSGHAARAVLLAGLAAELWPRYATAAYTGAALVVLGLQLKGAHPPADIAGGLLVGLALMIAVRAWEPVLPARTP